MTRTSVAKFSTSPACGRFWGCADRLTQTTVMKFSTSWSCCRPWDWTRWCRWARGRWGKRISEACQTESCRLAHRPGSAEKEVVRQSQSLQRHHKCKIAKPLLLYPLTHLYCSQYTGLWTTTAITQTTGLISQDNKTPLRLAFRFLRKMLSVFHVWKLSCDTENEPVTKTSTHM